MSILGQIILALLVGLATMPLLLPPGLLMVKSKEKLVASGIIADANVIPAPSNSPKKNNKCDIIRYSIGLILLVLIIFMTNFFIIVFAASFGTVLANQWLICFLLSLFQDFILLQTIKCLIIQCCTSEKAVSMFLECFVGNSM